MLDKNSTREPKVIVELVSKEHDARERRQSQSTQQSA